VCWKLRDNPNKSLLRQDLNDIDQIWYRSTRALAALKDHLGEAWKADNPTRNSFGEELTQQVKFVVNCWHRVYDAVELCRKTEPEKEWWWDDHSMLIASGISPELINCDPDQKNHPPA
jgi:hypothetical protein